ncbi:hypothetical protein [Paenibacillus tyrfis]|uniref:hypothetical protein n=1 Tax=Paenibacillus tyrfis TaxID=1501230 RepID=UPI000B591118|nr:hypothetical protein [Paenibacillus tyrfis]
MKLRLKKLVDKKAELSRTFEYMGDLFVLVNLTIVPPVMLSPVHWRLQYDKNPPLDMKINGDTGELSEITFFIADKKINSKKHALKENKINHGIPIFYTDLWENSARYFDEKGEINILRDEDCLVFNFTDSQDSELVYVNPKLKLIFNSDSFIDGFILSNLTEQELSVLRRASLI